MVLLCIIRSIKLLNNPFTGTILSMNSTSWTIITFLTTIEFYTYEAFTQWARGLASPYKRDLQNGKTHVIKSILYTILLLSTRKLDKTLTALCFRPITASQHSWLSNSEIIKEKKQPEGVTIIVHPETTLILHYVLICLVSYNSTILP